MSRPGRRFDRSAGAREQSDGAGTPDGYFPTLDEARDPVDELHTRTPLPARGKAAAAGDHPSAGRGTPATLDDPVLGALDALDDALAEANAGTARMRRRLATLREERAAGRGYAEIVAAEPAPRLVEMLADATRNLDAAGAEVRRSAARALHDEGMTMDEIATWFGVSRQRVSALLRDR